MEVLEVIQPISDISVHMRCLNVLLEDQIHAKEDNQYVQAYMMHKAGLVESIFYRMFGQFEFV